MAGERANQDPWAGDTHRLEREPEPQIPLGTAGPYVLVKRLGAGGMAEVYLAELTRAGGFKKTVVLKRILPQFAANPEYREMFLREGRTAALLSHPNVVQVFELGEEEGGSCYLAMEHVDGLPLSELARRTWAAGRALPLELVTSTMAEVALGLACAHDQGLVHRDVSPDNVMVSSTGVAKVVDFGIARPQTGGHLTATGELKGKLPYMAPEYLAGNSADRRCDLYALGVTLYWLATGARPFKFDGALVDLQAMLAEPPRPPRELNPNVPVALERLVLRCLEKDPARRPDSARVVAEDLFAIASALPDEVAAAVTEAMALPPAPRGVAFAKGAAAMSGGAGITTEAAVVPVVESTGTTRSLTMVSPGARGGGRLGAIAAGAALLMLVSLGVGASWLRGRGGAEDAELTTAPAHDSDAEVRAAPPVQPVDPPLDEPPAGAEAPESAPPDDEATSAAALALDVTAPDTVRWQLPSGATLGAGSGRLRLPAGTRSLVAVDVARDVRTPVTVTGRPVRWDALPQGRIEVKAAPGTQVRAGSTVLGSGSFAVDVVHGWWRLSCSWAGGEAKVRASVSPGASTAVACGPPPPATTATKPAAPERRSGSAQRSHDGASWMKSDGVLVLDRGQLVWNPEGVSSGLRALSVAVTDVATVEGRGDQLKVTMSWGSSYEFTTANAVGWARSISAARDLARGASPRATSPAR